MEEDVSCGQNDVRVRSLRSRKEGPERSSKKAEKKAEKMKDKAKKSKDGKDAAEAKESAKDAKKLRATVLRSIQKVDSAQDRDIRKEVGFVSLTNGAREIGHASPSRNWNAMIPKHGGQGERRKSDPEPSGVRQNLDHENTGPGYKCSRRPRTDQEDR